MALNQMSVGILDDSPNRLRKSLRERERQHFRIIPKLLRWMTQMEMLKVVFTEGEADLAGKRITWVTYMAVFLYPGKNF